MSDIYQKAIDFHRQYQGKLGVSLITPIETKEELSLVYTPGVAGVSRAIADNPKLSFDLTMRGRTVAVISDGSAVLGLGNIGAEAAMPVMEGKSLLLKKFANLDSVPLVIDTQDPTEIIKFVRQVAPSFAAINLEDIAAPNCFVVEESLQNLGIPVFHDDQHGTAVVISAALRNAAKVVGKNYHELKVVIVGSGAAGLATARMLLGMECSANGCSAVAGSQSVGDLIMVDSKGVISQNTPGLNIYKQVVAAVSNKEHKTGSLAEVIKGADVIIGVSRAGLIKPEMIKTMAEKPIVFALANPEPEIMPNLAKEAGAAVVATGRSDFANQINNVLAFPAIFRAAVDLRLPTISFAVKQAASQAISELIEQPSADLIIPSPFYPGLVEKIVAKIKTSISK
ncbi:MAG: NAD(P)-dependent malic enzyme [Patescibacteria group bacterium]